MTTWVSRYQKDKTSLDLNDARDDGVLGDIIASPGPYANNLHLTTDTNTSSLNFYTLDALPDAQPTVSKH